MEIRSQSHLCVFAFALAAGDWAEPVDWLARPSFDVAGVGPLARATDSCLTAHAILLFKPIRVFTFAVLVLLAPVARVFAERAKWFPRPSITLAAIWVSLDCVFAARAILFFEPLWRKRARQMSCGQGV